MNRVTFGLGFLMTMSVLSFVVLVLILHHAKYTADTIRRLAHEERQRRLSK